MIENRTLQDNSDTRPKWFNSPVSFYEGTLTNIVEYIPEFERRSFSLRQANNQHTRINERFDTIVRRPFRDDSSLVPVGIVSKEYVLVPHTEVLNVATKAIQSADIDKADVRAELKITEYGERMALSLYLPERYSFDPGDGYPLSLRLECFNSVDGSTRFRTLMGWFRLVCSNGLIIGVTQSDLRRRHVGNIRIQDIGTVLTSGIQESDKEKSNFERWRKHVVRRDRLNLWIQEKLRKEWGFKAAARLNHISRTGYDADVLGPYKNNTPLTIPTRQSKRVPGAPNQSGNLYDVSQILAWIAKERRDLQEQLKWREKISGLIEPLLS